MNRRMVISILALSIAAGCSTPASDARVTGSVPDRASFPDVAQALEHRCGMLDCHGTIYRNMRLYGNESLRLLPSDRPLSLPHPCTTSGEVDEDFASVVGLEPEVMSAVVADHGANPERLTFVRKPLGLESHKGGVVIQAGDDLDVCIRTWLRGQTQVDACQRVGPPAFPLPAAGQSPACQPGP